MAGTRPQTADTIVTLSYWRDLESLHAFAHGDLHREGWDWWNRNVKRWPHLGVMHEVYAAPEKCWENIYINFPAFGLGAVKVEQDGEGGSKRVLMEAKGTYKESMLGRMGRLGEI